MTPNALKIAIPTSTPKAGTGQTARAAGDTAGAGADFKHVLRAQRAASKDHAQATPEPAAGKPARAGGLLEPVTTTVAKQAKNQATATAAKHALPEVSEAGADDTKTTHLTHRLLIAYHESGQDEKPRTPAKTVATREAAGADETASATQTTRPVPPTAPKQAPKNKVETQKNTPRTDSHKTRQAQLRHAHKKHQDKTGAAQQIAAPPPGIAALVAQPPVAPVSKTHSKGHAEADLTRPARRSPVHQNAVLAQIADRAEGGAIRTSKVRQAATQAAVADKQTFALTQPAHAEHSDTLDTAEKSTAGNLPPGTPASLAPSAPVSANAATAAPPAFTATLATPIGSDAWNTALTQQSLHLSHNGGQAVLNLHPRALGPLQISLSLGQNNQQAQLHFVSPHADVRAAVEAALPQLRAAFAANGLSLGGAFVSDQGGQQSQSSTREDRRRSPERFAPLARSAPVPALRASILPGRTAAGGIDIFA
jgi:flagellar hook-length control protein FliK